jgi:hypothetical protein
MMRSFKRICVGVVGGLLAVSALSLPAHAADSDAADYLNELQAIAGQPVVYHPASEPISSSKKQVQPLALDPYGCTLYPSQVHLRKSGGYSTVGAKPYTTCVAGIPSSISQTSTLYIVEWAGLYYRPVQTKTSSNTLQKKLEQQNVAYSCVNSNNSIFQQKTDRVSVQGGQSYYSTVQTIRSTLACGY